MSNIPTTVRETPNGTMLEDGYSTKIAFENAPDIALWERTVQAAGRDGGDAIDITTMHNVTSRTKTSRALTDTTDGSFTAGYDPAVRDTIDAQVNVEQGITYTMPDGSTQNEWGYLRSFTPQSHSEGTMPEANVVIVHTNRNPTSKVEETGNYNSGTGTS